jgi:hypothetical protein
MELVIQIGERRGANAGKKPNEKRAIGSDNDIGHIEATHKDTMRVGMTGKKSDKGRDMRATESEGRERVAETAHKQWG